MLGVVGSKYEFKGTKVYVLLESFIMQACWIIRCCHRMRQWLLLEPTVLMVSLLVLVCVACFVIIALHDISLLKDHSIPPFVLPTPLTKQDRPLEYSYVMHMYMHTCVCAHTHVCRHSIHELAFTTLYMHSGVACSCDIQLTFFSLHRYIYFL